MLNDAKYLTENEKVALDQIKFRVSALFPVKQFILFGSKARGNDVTNSDIDLLIVTERELQHGERHKISNVITDVNYAYNTLFSFITVDDHTWNSRLYSFYPIHVNIEREGIYV
jgi:uncharacterized protein